MLRDRCEAVKQALLAGLGMAFARGILRKQIEPAFYGSLIAGGSLL
jgi:hypothetical protein